MRKFFCNYFLFMWIGSALSLNAYSAHMKVRIYKRVDASEATNTQFMTLTHGGDINFEEQISTMDGVSVGEFQSDITLIPSSDSVGTEEEPICIKSESVWTIDVSIGGTNISVIKRMRGSQFLGSKYVENDGQLEGRIEETGIPLPSVLNAVEQNKGVFQRKVVRPYYKKGKQSDDDPLSSFVYKIDDYMNGEKTENSYYGNSFRDLDKTVSLQEIILELLRNGDFKKMEEGMRFVDDLFHVSYGTNLEICFVDKSKRQIKVVINPYGSSQVYVMVISLTNEQLVTVPSPVNVPVLLHVAPGLGQQIEQGSLESLSGTSKMFP